MKSLLALVLLSSSLSISAAQSDAISRLYELGFLCSLEQANREHAYKLAKRFQEIPFYQQTNQKALIALSNCRAGSHHIVNN